MPRAAAHPFQPLAQLVRGGQRVGCGHLGAPRPGQRELAPLLGGQLLQGGAAEPRRREADHRVERAGREIAASRGEGVGAHSFQEGEGAIRVLGGASEPRADQPAFQVGEGGWIGSDAPDLRGHGRHRLRDGAVRAEVLEQELAQLAHPARHEVDLAAGERLADHRVAHRALVGERLLQLSPA